MANITTASALKSLPSVGKRIVNTQSDPLNMRQAPSTSSLVLVRIPKGATVDVLNCTTSSGWTAVRYNAKEGFVSTLYLSAIGTVTPVETTTTPVTTKEAASDVTATTIVQQTPQSKTSFTMPEAVKKYGKYVLIAAGVGLASYAAFKLFRNKGGSKRSRSLNGISRKVLKLK